MKCKDISFTSLNYVLAGLFLKNNVNTFSESNKKSCHPQGKQLWNYSLQMSTY